MHANEYLAAVQDMYRRIEAAIARHKARNLPDRTGGDASTLAPGDLVKLLSTRSPVDRRPARIAEARSPMNGMVYGLDS